MPGNSLLFPDGLTTCNNMSYSLPGGKISAQAGRATLEQTREYLLLNYLLRPPLHDAEILLMPAVEIIRLYYSLNVTTGCNQSRPNDTVSRGLPWRYGQNHDSYIVQNRIYKLRPDLHTIQADNGKSYPVLLTVEKMRAPPCDQTGEMIQFLSAILSVVTFGAAWYISLAVAAVEETATVVTEMQQAATAAKFKQMLSDTLTGIRLLAMSDPHTDPVLSLVSDLIVRRNYWRGLCNNALDHKEEILSWWPLLNGAYQIIPAYYEHPFAHSAGWDLQYMQMARLRNLQTINWPQPVIDHVNQYNQDWEPWSQYFYSDSVAAMVTDFENRNLPLPQNLVGSGP